MHSFAVHRFCSSIDSTSTHLMIVDEDVVQQIVQFDANEVAPTLRGKLVPVPFPTRTDLLQHFGIHVQLVLVDVCIEVVRAQHLRNATQLVDVPVRSEEGNLVEHESGDHASRPEAAEHFD